MITRLVLLLLVFGWPLFGDAQIYVAVNGSDNAEGTKEKPLATVHMALRKARELRRLNDASVANGIHIYIRKGVYHFTEPLFVRPEDAGTKESPTIIESLSNEKVVFDGGLNLSGWKKAVKTVENLPTRAQGKVWMTDAPSIGDNVLEFRQMWVNDRKAVRARDKDEMSMQRILGWNKKTEQCVIPKPAFDISRIGGVEMFIHQWWAIATLRVKKADVKGDSVLLSFYQPESRVQSEHPWPAPWISPETGNSAFYLTNAIQFLDEPGEWFLDKKNRKIYYWPKSDENLNTAVVVVPKLETLIRVEGTTEQPVTDLSFKGISFQHTTWLRPSQQGHVPHQIGMYMLDAYKLKQPGTPDKKSLENQAWVGRPAAAVSVSFAHNISFEDCRWERTASTGLDYGKGVQHSLIKGNLFKDIGGNAIVAGWFSDESSEVHLPYNPKDERVINDGLTISNNLINGAANEDWGCVGIAAGYLRNSTIEHNDISELPYMGISLGWGWSPTANVMKNNKIVGNRIVRFARHMYDVAGIYTLSSQPGTIISGNYLDSAYKAPYAHLPSHWFYLYTDEGSSYMTVKNNWTPSTKFLQNANGPGNVWENNGPNASDKIKLAAGLQDPYKKLLSERKIIYPKWNFVYELPVIIELVTKSQPDLTRLKDLLKQYKVDTTIYHWEDHYVIFGKVQDVSVLKGKIENVVPEAGIKVYYDAFYDFNRKYCADKTSAKEWDHVILTANLVDNPKLQKEYMDYHATQFANWPELSKGFCNAGFQQLLIYRNGRQLMLVISIPKGESLDKLNPKTTENNPRVDEWNKIMGKYQEGIEGTKPGQKWVFLEKIKN